MSESSFDVIPFEDIQGDWKKLGSGSFGNVYKGTYLGIDVAIKEVLPSTDYDVAKYFEREWRLMKEARHPNVVLYLGLSRAPDGRIFIISEYIENGNLRLYIHDKSKPFPWRLRISFAIDICRALAYLHARKCIHRDLKGENLLLTANGRLKITDFGFARIAARNADESKRLTFCGTDAYMSPEILLGAPFDLPTDIFSLGIIFAEIAARRLADDTHFKRAAPAFGVDQQEVRDRASAGCPEAFVELALACLQEDPAARPTVKEVLERLGDIEHEVIARPSEPDDLHVGSVKFITGGAKRPLRIPSFGRGAQPPASKESESEESEEEDVARVVMGLENVDLGLGSGWSDSPRLGHVRAQDSQDDGASTTTSDYSTTVIRRPAPARSPRSSILTARPVPPREESMMTIDSFHTATSSGADSVLSIAAATEGSSTLTALPPPAAEAEPDRTPSPPAPPLTAATTSPATPSAPPRPPSQTAMLHRFTLIKSAAKRSSSGGGSPSRDPSSTGTPPSAAPAPPPPTPWSPFDFFFASGLLVAKCDLCGKRLGWKPALECDDCGLRTHIKCGDYAPRDCGVRRVRPVRGASGAGSGGAGANAKR